MKPTQKLPSGLGSLVGKELPVSGLLKSMDLLGGDDADNFMGILKSRRIADLVIEKFNLVHSYGFDKRKKFYHEDVLKALYKNVDITVNDYGNIEVMVTDSSPTQAANMANFMVSQLDSISYLLSKESARNSRLFFEERLEVIKHDLDSAGRAFVKFQNDNKYVDLEQQVKASIEVMAQFEGQKMALDLEIAQLRNQFGATNQHLSELQKQKEVLDKKLSVYMDQGGGNLILSLKNAPEKAIQYGELMRNVKIQETLYEFVLQFYEQARLSEANNIPSVQVLEYASAPQKKLRPKRSVICLMFLLGGCIVMSTYILTDKWYEIQRRMQTQQFAKIKRVLDLISIRKRNA
jgi:capsule polysaccharide export protein KpsE/RkpR